MRCSECNRIGGPAEPGAARARITAKPLALLILSGCSLLAVAQADTDQVLREIRRQASAIEAQVRASPTPAWIDQGGRASGALRSAIQPIADQAARITDCAVATDTCAYHDNQALGVAPAADARPPVTFTLYASRSLGDGQLRELFAFAAGQSDTRVLFRGVGEDESLIAFIGSLRPLLAELDPPPTVQLDPTPFRHDGIEAVPTVVAHGPDDVELARVSGLASTSWLRAALEDGKRGDLGNRGPVRAISEPDMLAEIHRRLARIDFAALGEHALDKAFARLRFVSLPPAGEARERLIDPTLVAGADIRLPDGTLLVRAGETVNPLERMPFTQRLVVFDAADSRQLAFVRMLAGQGGDKPSVYLLSGLAHEDGWQELVHVSDALDSPVYLLTPELRQRFALERVPAVVEAVGRQFRITETAVTGLAVAETIP
jgi:conjugal transfer pilus assembly protein TraW